jgi:addiction module HigA family antidote
MAMHNPPHPGEIVKKALIDNTELTVTAAAQYLGIERVTLSNLINCKSGISPEMAVRLSIALDTSSEMWINMQAMYDLAQAERKRKRLNVHPIYDSRGQQTQL